MDTMEFQEGRCLRVKERKIYNDSKVDDEIEGKRKFCVEEKLHDEKFNQNLSEFVLELSGKDFDLKYIQEHGFNTPILFKEKDGLGLRMPDPHLFTVNDVKSYVGSRRMIDVFDCDTHQADQMSVYHWVRYYTGTEREKILNVTSLEFSHTGLDRIVECPTTVTKDLDWVQLVWPKHLIAEQKDTTNSIDNMKYPKVRKYVLMSVAGCYTDFHIDFGGSSVWYHVLKGAKVFWLIPPTEPNLGIYERWVLSGRQQDVFLGDLVENCYRIHLVAGDTFMIPTGWIHSVYTPDDSLVFGGNYLHSFNIPMQFKTYDIEENTHVPKRLRYPFFTEIHWYIIKAYLDILEKDLDERRILEFEEDNDEGAFKMVKDEIDNEIETEKSKTKWQCVYLTVYEMEGLKFLCERFRTWSYAKLNYPKDLAEDGMELLDRLEEILQHHEEDDQILACRGTNIFEQFELKKEVKAHSTSPLNTPLDQPFKKTPTPPKVTIKKEPIDEEEQVKRKILFENEKKSTRDGTSHKTTHKDKVKKEKKIIRRVRCHTCEGCVRSNCDGCKFCLDMTKNGGTGRLRQSCALRFCKDPQLPNYVRCKICNNGKGDKGEVLMECSSCGEIVHPTCLDKKAPCKISKKVNNSWECPNCCEDAEATEFSTDLVGGVISETKKKWQEQMLNNVGSLPLKNKKTRKVDNLKSIIKNLKFLKKVKREDTLADKRNGHDVGVKRKIEDQSDDSDDEPLIKKKNTKIVSNGISVNGHELKPPEVVKPISVIRPGPIESPYECTCCNDELHVLHGDLWIRVYTYLSKSDILSCMTVCKAWNQWCINSKLWKIINISNKTITQSILKGIVRRQPAELNLSSTDINSKQLQWLLQRVPSLERLDLSLNTAFTVSAIMRVICPPLVYLNLSWCDAIYDRFVTQLFAPVRAPSNEAVPISRLHYMESINLTGCDISDETVIYILLTLTVLRHLDVSHCVRVSSSCLDPLIKGTSVCKESLKKFVCIGCPLMKEKTVLEFQNKVTVPEIVISAS